jgi:AraC family transcriptional regulator
MSVIHSPPNGHEGKADFSMLTTFEHELAFRGFSIKYVLEGCEHYVINGRPYDVRGGEYLLANHACAGRVRIDSKTVVKGVCINLSPALLGAVLSSHLVPDSPYPDMDKGGFFGSDHFLENKYTAKGSQLGQALEAVGRRLTLAPEQVHDLDQDFYCTLAERIVADHHPILAQLYGIRTVKQETRKDLYRRVCRGKAFLEENYAEKISVARMAQEAALSEYHFLRLFKAAFSATPQQYLIRVRLSKACEMLRSGHFSATEVAFATGFSDASHFSHCFKKQFGVPPVKMSDPG